MQLIAINLLRCVTVRGLILNKLNKEVSMGQAKLRGTFEVRKAEGAAKQLQARLERERLDLELRLLTESKLTPRQKQKRKEAKLLLASVLALTAGF